jgi:glutathione S-transferase
MFPTLYHVPRTISSPIYQTLLELNLVNDPVHVKTLTFPELKSPAHLERNPMGTSPTFTDDSSTELPIAIWESGAVFTYVLEVYDTSFKLHPQPGPTPQQRHDRAKFLHVQQFITATVYPFMASLHIHAILNPKEQHDEAYIKKGKDTWRNQLAPVLAAALGDNPYFMGNRISAVDMLAAKPLNNASSLGLLDELPCLPLKQLFHQVRCRPTFGIAYGEDLSEQECVACRSMVLLPGEGTNP